MSDEAEGVTEPGPERPVPTVSRRALLAGAAGAIGGAVLGAGPLDAAVRGIQQSAQPMSGGTVAAAVPVAAAAATVPPLDATKVPGLPTGPLGLRSSFVNASLEPVGVTTGATFTPLQDIMGTITPSALHFERVHNGIAVIDPVRYELFVHGMVEREVVFSLADLKRFPSVTRNYFVECSGNGRTSYRDPKPEMTAQVIAGLTSNSEWTGVLVADVLREVGVKSGATWFLAEGGDAARLRRSIPVAKGMDDAMLAYAQNGEPVRTGNGYPVRLLLPGYEGNMCIKWIHRIKLTDGPVMARDETAKYTDPLPDGKARQFSFVMDAMSIITSPSYPERLTGAGWYPISGLAWSGRGKIERVDVSADGGKSWVAAELQGPVHTKAHTRFQLMWEWNGRDAVLMSRAIDETGYVQPTLAEFEKVRGPGTDFHFNAIKPWKLQADGRLFFGVGL